MAKDNVFYRYEDGILMVETYGTLEQIAGMHFHEWDNGFVDDIPEFIENGAELRKIIIKDESQISRNRLVKLLQLNFCNVEEIEIDNDYFKSVDGIVYTADMKSLIFCPKQKAGKILIPPGVRTISNAAFCGCLNIEEVCIPDSVEYIMGHAFAGCELLSTVTGGMGLKNISQCAFLSCQLLSEFPFHEGIRTIGYGAFQSCVCISKVNLPTSVTSLGQFAFFGIDKIFVHQYNKSVLYAITGLPQTNIRSLSTDFVTLYINDKKPLLIPRYIDWSRMDELDRMIKKFVKTGDEKYSMAYKYAKTNYAIMTVAVEHCKHYDSKSAKTFLTKNVKEFVECICSDEGEPGIVRVVKSGVLTDTALRRMLEFVQEKGFMTASAYILETLGEKKKTFGL